MSWGELTCEWLTEYENRPCNPTMQTCNKFCDNYRLKHNTDGVDCWCDPEIIEFENGNKVIIHQEEQ